MEVAGDEDSQSAHSEGPSSQPILEHQYAASTLPPEPSVHYVMDQIPHFKGALPVHPPASIVRHGTPPPTFHHPHAFSLLHSRPVFHQHSSGVEYPCEMSNSSTDSTLDSESPFAPMSGVPVLQDDGQASYYLDAFRRDSHTPPRETVVEITQLQTPGDGYFSRENLKAGLHGLHRPHRPTNKALYKARREAHMRGLESTPPAQTIPYGSRERTPSPQPVAILDFKEESSRSPVRYRSPKRVKIDNNCISFQSRRPTQVTSTPISRAGGDAPQKIVVNFGAGVMNTMKIKNEKLFPSSVAIPRSVPAGQLTSPTTYSPSPIGMPRVHDRSQTPSSLMAAIKLDGTPVSSHAGRVTPAQSAPSTPRFSSPGTPTMMDTSLTNIQWLGAMNGTGMPLQQSPNLTELTSSSTPGPTTSQTPLELSQDSLPSNDSGFVSDQSGNQASLLSNNSILGLQSPFTTATISLPNDHRDIRVIASEKQIEKISRECGRKKRPPYSYMHLIQMAISSRADKRMTLRDIYKWIEEKFPYYKFSPKQGWKNSIRHNLSLYDIFVRQKSTVPGQTGCSYWTLNPEYSHQSLSKIKSHSASAALCQDETATSTQVLEMINSQSSPNFMHLNSSDGAPPVKTKKGPAPLLPKPPPMYALIPIQNNLPLMSSQHLMLSSMANPVPIAPATSLTAGMGSPVLPNLLPALSPQSGYPASASDKLPLMKRLVSGSEATAGPRKQPKVARKASILTRRSSFNNGYNTPPPRILGNVYDGVNMQVSCVSNVSMDQGYGDSFNGENSNGATDNLPKPKLRHKKPRKEKQLCRTDSVEKEKSPESKKTKGKETGLQDMIHNLNNDLNSPLRGFMQTPPKNSQLTSTPFCGENNWMSPETGNQNLNYDGFVSSSDKPEVGRRGHSPGVGSLSELGLPGLTPQKNSLQQAGNQPSPGHSPNSSLNMSNQSFTRLIDGIMDDPEGLGGMNITSLLFESDGSS